MVEPLGTDDSLVWPPLDLHYWQLEDAYRGLRACVLACEEALRMGELSALLRDGDYWRTLGPHVAAIYRRLAAAPRPAQIELRHEAALILLEQVREDIFTDRTVAEAEVLSRWEAPEAEVAASIEEPAVPNDTTQGREPAPPPARIRMVSARFGVGAAAPLRMDQVLSARCWGIAFQFVDSEDSDYVARSTLEATSKRLASDLRDLHKILTRIGARKVPVRQLVPRPRQRRFERLVLDVINEPSPTARLAPLEEDILEKTDLRLRLTGLARKRGARIQVTQIAHVGLHEEKLARIPAVEQLVVLSPLTLAQFVARELMKPTGLLPQEVQRLLDLFPDRPADAAALATSIKRAMLRALQPPWPDPRGPAAAVPKALRYVIQRFAESEAFRSTSVLREAETVSGRIDSGGAQPKAAARRKAQREQPAKEVVAALEVGQVIRGVVTNVVDYGLFVSLGSCVGLLHRSELSLTAEQSAHDFYKKKQAVDVIVINVDAGQGKVFLARAPKQGA
jgi:hypothetical protein